MYKIILSLFALFALAFNANAQQCYRDNNGTCYHYNQTTKQWSACTCKGQCYCLVQTYNPTTRSCAFGWADACFNRNNQNQQYINDLRSRIAALEAQRQQTPQTDPAIVALMQQMISNQQQILAVLAQLNTRPAPSQTPPTGQQIISLPQQQPPPIIFNPPPPQSPQVIGSLPQTLVPQQPLPQTLNPQGPLPQTLNPQGPLVQILQPQQPLPQTLVPQQPLPQTLNPDSQLPQTLSPGTTPLPQSLPQSLPQTLTPPQSLTPQTPIPQGIQPLQPQGAPPSPAIIGNTTFAKLVSQYK